MEKISLRNAPNEVLLKISPQGIDSLSEAWERFMALTRRCPCHGISSWKLLQTFNGGLNNPERNLVDIATRSTFVENYVDEFMKFMKRLMAN